MKQSITFVLGGAASGKSAYAETRVTAHPGPWIYIATAQAHDAEMARKIEIHQGRRGAGWQTVEAPLDLGSALGGVTGGIVLVDCVTLWLSNHLLAEADLDARSAELMEALATCRAPVVVVSNEVGQGVVPAHAMGRRFRETQGRLNVALAARADLVVQVVAGLPNVLKGTP
ncbi:bifunctional adenosylcobinamide kinase/adenosylcobinamide-phosphate guanylyltransferase [Marinibacterium sp. SX1]|uniref:bifunctional adenosylcobinamide kinase/adenosylcobinamide-phosphate guanylyltransferase n=1 Tax=Marinibacterium sp. SX1 TaxID=3388424 RepID=UPI003D174813